MPDQAFMRRLQKGVSVYVKVKASNFKERGRRHFVQFYNESDQFMPPKWLKEFYYETDLEKEGLRAEPATFNSAGGNYRKAYFSRGRRRETGTSTVKSIPHQLKKPVKELVYSIVENRTLYEDREDLIYSIDALSEREGPVVLEELIYRMIWFITEYVIPPEHIVRDEDPMIIPKIVEELQDNIQPFTRSLAK